MKKKQERTKKTKKKSATKRKTISKKSKKVRKTKKKKVVSNRGVKKLVKKKEIVTKKKIKKIENKRPKINENDRSEVLRLFSDAYARQVMIALGGENALEVIRSYPSEMSDEEIARKLKVKISDIRSTLNRMHGEGFVAYDRKKDGETGWYSYSWSLNKKNIMEWANRISREKEELMNSNIEKYYCKKCGFDSLVDFVNAANTGFKCNCCNDSLKFLERKDAEQLFKKVMPSQIKRRREA